MGYTEVVQDTQTIVHLIRRNHIRDLIDSVEQEIETNDLSPWIRHKIITLKSKADILIAHRQKRGLINIVGQASKWLFGTMDDKDRDEINEHIQELESNSQNLINGLNKQIKINDYFNETIHLFVQTNQKNQNQILKSFSNLSEEVKNLIKSQRILDISLKLEILDDKLNQILDSIASIKAGILHPGILTSNEINQFKINLEKLQNARSGILEMNQNVLLIGIKIPTSYERIPYKLLTPLPNNDCKEIAENPQKFIEVDKIKYILEKDVLYKNELKPLKTCLDTVCYKRINQKEEIIRLSNNVILGVNLKNPNIRNNCDERKLNLLGNYILEIRNCTLVINNKTYSDIYKEYEDNYVFEMFNQKWKEINVTFEEANIKYINNLEEIHKFHFHKKLTFSMHGTMFIIMVIVISFVSWKFCYNKIKCKKDCKNLKTLHQESKDHLKEGEVTLEMSPPRNTMAVPTKDARPSFLLGAM